MNTDAVISVLYKIKQPLPTEGLHPSHPCFKQIDSKSCISYDLGIIAKYKSPIYYQRSTTIFRSLSENSGICK